jgi:hypothetical protein
MRDDDDEMRRRKIERRRVMMMQDDVSVKLCESLFGYLDCGTIQYKYLLITTERSF